MLLDAMVNGIILFHLFLCWCIAINDFCVFTLYPVTILNSFSSSSSCLLDSDFLHLSSYHIQTEIVLLLSSLDSFYFFYFPALLARTSRTILNSSGKAGILVLLLIPQEKAFNLSPRAWCYLWVLHKCPFSCAGTSHLFLVFWVFLSWNGVGVCHILLMHCLI